MDIQELNKITVEVGQFVKQNKNTPYILELHVSRAPQYPTGIIFVFGDNGEWYMQWDGGSGISEHYISVLYRILQTLNKPFKESVEEYRKKNK